MVCGLRTSESNNLEDGIVDLYGVFSCGRLLNECADSPDDLARAIPLLDNTRERVIHLAKIRWLSAQETSWRNLLRDCRCNRLVHFMGDRGRQLAHRRDAVGVRELQLRLAVSLLVFASFCLYCPQCRNVGAGAAITAEFFVRVKHWLAAGLPLHWRPYAVLGAIYEVVERLA